MKSFRWDSVAGWAVAAALGTLLQWTGVLRPVDALLLDTAFGHLRRSPRPLAPDVAVVGIDERSVAAFAEPLSLWHRHYAGFLRAMVAARASVVGLDVVLPDRSFRALLPGYDRELLEGLVAARDRLPIVLGQTLDDTGRFRRIFAPFLAAVGPDGLGSVIVCRDPDLILRRFQENLCDADEPTPTLVGQMARRLGLRVEDGLIDYGVGPALTYTPFDQVVEWHARKNVDRLRAAFEGRPVLLGAVLALEDRLDVPVAIAAWESGSRRVPGVLIHAQALRSLMGRGMLADAPAGVVALLSVLAGVGWMLGARPGLGLLAWSAVSAALVWSSIALLERGLWLPVAGVVATGLLGLGLRGGRDAASRLRERRMLQRSFGSYVSPQVMDAILRGELQPELGGRRQWVCVLFSDIRDFTSRSEHLPPEEVIMLLNRYFTEMTLSIHGHGGTIDKFMGDGIMAFFGAPHSLDQPERHALAAAREMLARLEGLNTELGREGIAPIRIGVGLHSGEAVIGHVGSALRHEYTAIGDVVNTASRLEGLTKTAGYAVVCSELVRARLSEEGFSDLGERPLKGRTPLRVFGWNGSRVAAPDAGLGGTP